MTLALILHFFSHSQLQTMLLHNVLGECVRVYILHKYRIGLIILFALIGYTEGFV